MTEAECRRIVADRAGDTCEVRLAGVCQGRASNMHHRRKHGRDWTPSNVLHVCGSGTTGCHGWIEHHPDLARELGLWVDSTGDPAATPATLWPETLWRDRWLLDELGDYLLASTHAGE